MIFVDANYFLRFLLQDIKDQYLISKKLFLEAAREEIELVTSTTVFFEVYFVLKSSYFKNKSAENRLNLAEALFELLKLNLELEDRTILFEALDYYQELNLELEDCYHLAFAKQVKARDFKTFDLKLAKAFAKEINEA